MPENQFFQIKYYSDKPNCIRQQTIIFDNRTFIKIRRKDNTRLSTSSHDANGNGETIYYELDRKTIRAKGAIKNYKKNGEWQYFIQGKTSLRHFENSKRQSGYLPTGIETLRQSSTAPSITNSQQNTSQTETPANQSSLLPDLTANANTLSRLNKDNSVNLKNETNTKSYA